MSFSLSNLLIYLVFVVSICSFELFKTAYEQNDKVRCISQGITSRVASTLFEDKDSEAGLAIIEIKNDQNL